MPVVEMQLEKTLNNECICILDQLRKNDDVLWVHAV